jgi:hypothetical protein
MQHTGAFGTVVATEVTERLVGELRGGIVPMVPAVDFGARHDVPGRGRHHRPRRGRVLLEAQVRPRTHVIRDVGVTIRCNLVALSTIT